MLCTTLFSKGFLFKVVAPPRLFSGCEFDPRLRRLFFPAYFRLSPLQKHVRKVVGGFGKESTGVRKPGKTCVTERHDMTLVVKVALNPNTTIQPTKSRECLEKN